MVEDAPGAIRIEIAVVQMRRRIANATGERRQRLGTCGVVEVGLGLVGDENSYAHRCVLMSFVAGTC